MGGRVVRVKRLTSATGTIEFPRAPARLPSTHMLRAIRSCRVLKHAQPCGLAVRGFSLIEILVVLVIVAVVAAAVSLGVASVGGERVLAREAERFQALLLHACTQAELAGRDVGMQIDAQGYAFSELGLQGWLPPGTEGELRRRSWVAGMQVQLSRDEQIIDVPAGDALDTPQLVCFSSGELTPFELRMTVSGVGNDYLLRGGADGSVSLSHEERR